MSCLIGVVINGTNKPKQGEKHLNLPTYLSPSPYPSPPRGEGTGGRCLAIPNEEKRSFTLGKNLPIVKGGDNTI